VCIEALLRLPGLTQLDPVRPFLQRFNDAQVMMMMMMMMRMMMMTRVQMPVTLPTIACRIDPLCPLLYGI
jgi:hypothetical protein